MLIKLLPLLLILSGCANFTDPREEQNDIAFARQYAQEWLAYCNVNASDPNCDAWLWDGED